MEHQRDSKGFIVLQGSEIDIDQIDVLADKK